MLHSNRKAIRRKQLSMWFEKVGKFKCKSKGANISVKNYLFSFRLILFFY